MRSETRKRARCPTSERAGAPQPYIVALQSNSLTVYDETFEGYGNDKDQLHFALALRGVQYVVLDDAFVVHWRHEATAWARSALPVLTRRWRTFAFFYALVQAALGERFA